MSSVNWELENEKSCVYPFSPRTLAYFSKFKNARHFDFSTLEKQNKRSLSLRVSLSCGQPARLNITNQKLTALEFRLCEDFQAAWKIHVTVSAFLKDSDSQLRKSVCS